MPSATSSSPRSRAAAAGALLGTKTALNEFIAYIDLAKTPPEALSPRSKLLMTYALCGFANFGSLGILIGGMGAMVPEEPIGVASARIGACFVVQRRLRTSAMS